MIEHVVAGGVDYIVALGTTGETPVLSVQEKLDLIAFSIEKIQGRVPLVVGAGGNNTAEVIRFVKILPSSGIDAILSVSPYYNKPNQEGIYLHFKAISETSPFPLILYTVPGRTGSNIAASTTLRLAREFPNITGIKEASGNFDQIYTVLKNRPDYFLVISGDDALTLPLLSAGADGVISVIANLYPEKFSSMVSAGLAGDFGSARVIHFDLLEIMNALFMDGSPGGIKAALETVDLCRNILRLPLTPVSDPVKKHIQDLIAKIKSHEA
jgi:4-hydroxy-tetrahydrodipicolinate synthase